MAQPGSRWHDLPAAALQFKPSRQTVRLHPFLSGMCPGPQTTLSANIQRTLAAGAMKMWDENTRRLYPSSLSHIQAGYAGAGTP